MIVGTAEVDINARVDKLDPQLEKALGDAAKKAGDSAERELGDKFKKIGANMTKFVTLPVVGGFALATKAASDLGEQTDKATVVFGESSDRVKKFSKDAAQSFGLSERAALSAAGTYGNLFRAIGVTADKSAEMSIKLTGLAADLASFNDVPVEEVFDALRSGLTGETEPLKRFGINLNDVALKAEAVRLKLHEGTGVLSASAKAQAAYSLILKDSALAQGNFALTGDSLANQTRKTKAELENTAAAIGQKLIPAAVKIAQTIQTVLEVLDGVPGGAENVLLIGTAALAVVGPVAAITGRLINLQTALRASQAAGSSAAGAAATGFKYLGVATGVGIAITGVATAVALLNKNAEPTPEQLAKIQSSLLKIGTTGAPKATKEIANLVRLITQSEFGRGKAGEAFDAIDESLAELVRSGNADAAKKALNDIAIAGGSSSTALLKQKGVLDDYKAALAEVKVGTEKKAAADTAAAKAASDNQSSTEKQAEAFDTLEKSIAETKKTMDRYLGVQISVDEAFDEFKQASDDLTASIRENGNTFDANTESGRKNRESARALVTQATELQRAEELQSGVLLTEAQRRDRVLALMDDQTKNRSPAERAEIARLVASIRAIPDASVTEIRVITSQALTALETIRTAMFENIRLAGIPLTPQVRGQISRDVRNQRAGGGQVFAGKLYQVGETGPEPFIPAVNGRILSTQDARTALAQAGDTGSGITLNFNPVITGNYPDRATLLAELRNVANESVSMAIGQLARRRRAPAGIT